MNKTIKVEGNAAVQRKPDRMDLAFTYHFQKEKYEEVLQLFETSYSRFLEAMEKAGVPTEQIKTAHFSVHPKYEQEYDGKVCVGLLKNATDAYEWSFVPVPAQPKAGTTKSSKAGEPPAEDNALADMENILNFVEF